MKEEILQQIKLQDVLNYYNIELIRNKACCPFHNEKTPSFSVKNEIWKCFGCGSGGDLFTFVMKIENVNFNEACRILNEVFSLNLGEKKSFSDFRKQKKREEERKKEKEKKEKDQEVIKRNYNILCVYNKKLLREPYPQTKEVVFDLELLERTFERCKENEEILIKKDMYAFCKALLTKHKIIKDKEWY